MKEISVLDNPKGNWNRHFETGTENKHLETDFSFIDDKIEGFIIKYHENDGNMIELYFTGENPIDIVYTENGDIRTIKYNERSNILNDLNSKFGYYSYLFYVNGTIPFSYGMDLITDILLFLIDVKNSELRDKLSGIFFPIHVMFIELNLRLWEKTLSRNKK